MHALIHLQQHSFSAIGIFSVRVVFKNLNRGSTPQMVFLYIVYSFISTGVPVGTM